MSSDVLTMERSLYFSSALGRVEARTDATQSLAHYNIASRFIPTLFQFDCLQLRSRRAGFWLFWRRGPWVWGWRCPPCLHDAMQKIWLCFFLMEYYFSSPSNCNTTFLNTAFWLPSSGRKPLDMLLKRASSGRRARMDMERVQLLKEKRGETTWKV